MIKTKRLLLTLGTIDDLTALEEIDNECGRYFAFDPPSGDNHDCPLEECERRDVKGFYARARRGEIKNYTGISAGYEPPSSPDHIIKTSHASKEESVAALMQYILVEAACQADYGLLGRLHHGVPISHAWNNAT